METLGDVLVTKKGEKGGKEYYCDICNVKCCDLYKWKRHILTSKHTKLTVGDVLVTKKGEKGGNEQNYLCEFCNKIYSSRNGLWKHKKTCNNIKKFNGMDKDELIITLLKQNADLMKGQQDITMEIVKNGINNTNHSHNTHTNSHNKAFNLNFFLNETCKNAMDITDFVDSIKLQLTDFMEVGEVGFIEGISNIIVKNLNNLDETIRPIHCTDQKRETFYVKDEGKWEKEEEEKKKLKKMIKNVAFKNEKLMKTYKETYPDYNDPKSKRSDQYSKTVIEAMDTKEENREKIIKNISKATTIKQSRE